MNCTCSFFFFTWKQAWVILQSPGACSSRRASVAFQQAHGPERSWLLSAQSWTHTVKTNTRSGDIPKHSDAWISPSAQLPGTEGRFRGFNQGNVGALLVVHGRSGQTWAGHMAWYLYSKGRARGSNRFLDTTLKSILCDMQNPSKMQPPWLAGDTKWPTTKAPSVCCKDTIKYLLPARTKEEFKWESWPNVY